MYLQAEIQDILKIGYLNGLFVLARSIGLIGHALDQKRLQQGLYRHPWDEVQRNAFAILSLQLMEHPLFHARELGGQSSGCSALCACAGAVHQVRQGCRTCMLSAIVLQGSQIFADWQALQDRLGCRLGELHEEAKTGNKLDPCLSKPFRFSDISLGLN